MCSRTRLGGAVLILAAVISGCRDPSVADPPAVVPTSSIPAPVEPKWLTTDDLEKVDEAAIDEIDVFVLMSSAALEAGSDTAKAASDRDEALTAVVLMTKYLLHQLFYEVSFDTNLHPADDPRFYNALVMFEQNAGLSVDGTFSFAEFGRLSYLAGLETEQRITLPFKFVRGNGSTYVTATGTWVLQGEQIAYPLNTSEITCRRSDGLCVDFHVDVHMPTSASPGSFPYGMSSERAHNQYFYRDSAYRQHGLDRRRMSGRGPTREAETCDARGRVPDRPGLLRRTPGGARGGFPEPTVFRRCAGGR